MTVYQELNCDGLVGPFHHFGGHSLGNIASKKHQLMPSSPKKAALQGLEKMKLLMDLGVPQLIMPPQERPLLHVLHDRGYRGSLSDRLDKAYSDNLLPQLYSSSSMWAANAATQTPSLDTNDGLMHITPANLSSNVHRCYETSQTERYLNFLFHDKALFRVHPPLTKTYPDEGAANHTRFCSSFSKQGLHLFVYGKEHGADLSKGLFPARHVSDASQLIITNHHLKPGNTILIQQSHAAIQAGVFHNDVIAVGHQDFFLYHEQAFQGSDIIHSLKRIFNKVCNSDLHCYVVPKEQLSLDEAVSSYIFNSQIISCGKEMVMIIPEACKDYPNALRLCQSLESGKWPIKKVHFVSLDESMKNGGGPACLRLRLVLNQDEIEALPKSLFLTEMRYVQLKKWIKDHYRDILVPNDFRDPGFISEIYSALEALTQLLELGSDYYTFQEKILE